MAALLHDVIEDTARHQGRDRSRRFGKPVAELVDGVSKLDKIEFQTPRGSAGRELPQDAAGDGARRARHPDQARRPPAQHAHAGRDAAGASASASRARRWTSTRRSRNRLGLNTLYRELQELAFSHLYPLRYRVLAKAIKAARGNRREVIEQDRSRRCKKQLGDSRHRGDGARAARSTSTRIYKKMREKHLSFSQVLDIYGFRVIVDDVPDVLRSRSARCTRCTSRSRASSRTTSRSRRPTATSRCTPTLFGPFGTPVEVQIRTEDMHRIAEAGVAAHWLYKDDGDSSSPSCSSRPTTGCSRCSRSSTQSGDSQEFLEHVKVDLFPDEVYVFTPKGKIMALPRGATAVDFAYAMHTDIGNRCVAAQDQQRAGAAAHRAEATATASRSSPQPTRKPNPAWLQFVRTGKARSQHPPLPEDHAVRGIGRARRAPARRRRCARSRARSPRSTTPAGSAAARRRRAARARSCSPTSAWASACRRWWRDACSSEANRARTASPAAASPSAAPKAWRCSSPRAAGRSRATPIVGSIKKGQGLVVHAVRLPQ